MENPDWLAYKSESTEYGRMRQCGRIWQNAAMHRSSDVQVPTATAILKTFNEAQSMASEAELTTSKAPARCVHVEVLEIKTTVNIPTITFRSKYTRILSHLSAYLNI